MSIDETRTYGPKLFETITNGDIKIVIYNVYPFTVQGVQDAQRDLTSGQTTGKLIIDVSNTSA